MSDNLWRSVTTWLRPQPACTLIAAVWLAATACRVALPQAGLRAEYFPNPTWSGPAARTAVDREISSRQLSRGWGYTPPDVFSVRWSGYLHVSSADVYTFTLNSDDGSRLYVDRQLTVDNSGAHGAPGRSGRVRLERGRHPITLEYVQEGGGYSLDWSWAPAAGVPTAVPVSRLSPHPSQPALLAIQAFAAAAWPALTLLLAIACVRVAMVRRWWPARPAESAADEARWLPAARSWQSGVCAALFVVLAIAHTWPLATAPGHLSRNDNADTMLNEWTLAWVAHQLPRQPAGLFDANIFYPERAALGFSEALVLQGVAAAPLLWAGASPVLAYNLLLLAGFVLTGWAACLVVAKWTGDWIAGLTAGTLTAFNAHTLTRLPHIQAQHAELMPLALLALDALLRKPRRSAALLLGGALALQALASIYLFVFTVVALVVATLVRPEDWVGGRFRAVCRELAVAVGVAAAVMLPFLWPYWQLRSRGFVRTLDEAGWFAAGWRDYLTTPARWYGWAGGSVALFPGLTALLLAAAALGAAAVFRDRRPRMCAAFAAVGIWLSFGPAVVPGYEPLFRWLPLLQAVRATARFGYLGLVGLAVLAGYGVAAIRRRLPADSAAGRLVTAAIVAGVAIEPFAGPIEYARFDDVSPIYRLVSDDERTVVAELPFPRPESVYLNARFMLNSTLNWKPMLNGYSGLTPPTYYDHFAALETFPSETSLAALRRARVTDIFVHFDELDPGARAVLSALDGVREIATDGPVTLYRLAPDGRRAARSSVFDLK